MFHQHFESIWARLTKVKQHKNSCRELQIRNTSPNITYQQEQKGHFRVTKEEPKGIDQQNLDIDYPKKELQEHEHQTLDSNAIKDEIENQGSRVDVKGQLGKVTIDQLYNQKFKNLFYITVGCKGLQFIDTI